jgi:uncharacterized protein (TIGR03067 family)
MFRRLVLLLIATTAVARAADPAKSRPKGDLERLQGRWVGKAGPARDIDVTIEIDGRKAVVRIAAPNGLKLRARGELRIDETTTPKALDWVHFRGPGGRELPEILGIYRLDGPTLTVRNAGPNDDRPAEFKPGDGPLADLITLEKVLSAE